MLVSIRFQEGLCLFDGSGLSLVRLVDFHL
jgi:hypothetical protein